MHLYHDLKAICIMTFYTKITEVECPPLDPPMNGALAYETVNRRPAVILSCNEHFDIPSIDGFNGQLFCYDSGSWYPLDQTPDCICKYIFINRNLPALYDSLREICR